MKCSPVIESIHSPSGEILHCLNGRALGSHRDPLGEAEKWVRRRLARFHEHSNLVVLGLGSGHHLIELIRVLPKVRVTVIELVPQLIEDFKAQHGLDSESVKVVCPKKEASVFDSKEFAYLPGGDYGVSRFYPATAWNQEAYDKLQEELIGRAPHQWAQVRERRPELNQISGLQVGPIVSAGELIGVKHLLKGLTPGQSSDAIVSLKLLGEMIR